MSMEPASLVRQTLECLEAESVPSELREVAFAKVFDLLSGGPPAPSPRDQRPPDPAVTATRRPDAGTEDWLARIAARVNLSTDQVESVYFLDGDKLELVVAPGRFETAKTRGTEQIALLVAAGRQSAGLDEDWTSVDPIREQCEHFKRYDASNFASTIKAMHDIFTVRGAGRDRKVRMTAPAWHKAAELVQSLAAGS